MLDRHTAPAFSLPDHINLPKVNQTKFANGLQLHYLEGLDIPAIKLEAVFASGSYDAENPAISYFAFKMLSEGTINQKAEQIAEKLDYLGAYLEINTSFDHSSVAIYGLQKDAETLSALLFDILEHSNYPEQEMLRMVKIKRESLELESRKTGIVASKQLREQVFGIDHPYGRRIELEHLKDEQLLERVKAYHSAHIKGQYELMASGYIDHEVLVQLSSCFEKAAISARVNGERQAKQIGEIESSQVSIPFPDSVQSSIRMGHLMPHKSDIDFIKINIANKLLGGFFGSRLMKQIREEMGLTYGISSSVLPLKYASMLFIGAEIKSGVQEETIQAIKLEIDKLRNELVGEKELEVLKNYLTGAITLKLNNPFVISDAYRDLYLFNQDLSYYDDFLKVIRGISAGDLQKIYQQYFQPENLHITITH